MKKTTIKADSANVRVDQAMKLVTIPMIVDGDIDWQWYNYFGEEVKRHNNRLPVEPEQRAWLKNTSHTIDLVVPYEKVKLTPEFVKTQEALAIRLAAIVDPQFEKMKATKKEDAKAKEKQLSDAIEAIRKMK